MMELNVGIIKVILQYLRKQHLAILAIVVSTLTFCHQSSMDQLQAEFIKSHGESLTITLSRNRINDENGSNYVWNEKVPFVETAWDVELDNISIQTPITISTWNTYTKTGDEFRRSSGSSDIFISNYTPFFKENDDPLTLPLTLAAGNTLRIRLKQNLAILQEATEKLYE